MVKTKVNFESSKNSYYLNVPQLLKQQEGHMALSCLSESKLSKEVTSDPTGWNKINLDIYLGI